MRRIRTVVPISILALASLGCNQQDGTARWPSIPGQTQTYTFSPSVSGLSQWKVGPGQWQAVEDESSPSRSGHVLASSGSGSRASFHLCTLDGAKFRDVKVSVKFRAVAGEIDRGGGIAWRSIDSNNYYLCRFNPLEKNLRVYKVIAGKRTQLASKNVTLPSDRWHTLTVAMKGDTIVAEVGRSALEVRDDTIEQAGRVGLWTKADARTYFDEFRVTGSPE